jgi:hypothetical protein
MQEQIIKICKIIQGIDGMKTSTGLILAITFTCQTHKIFQITIYLS